MVLQAQWSFLAFEQMVLYSPLWQAPWSFDSVVLQVYCGVSTPHVASTAESLPNANGSANKQEKI